MVAEAQNLRVRRIGTITAGILVLGLLGTGWTAGQTADDTFLDGLRHRRLFSLAERYCTERLQDKNLDQRDRVGLVIELIRTYAEHATHSPPTDRDARWQRARETAADFLQQQSDNPRRELVQVQDALTALAQGELARMEAEVAARPEQALARARDTIREAARLLEQIEKQLSQPATAGSSGGNQDDALTSNERFALQNHVQFQLVRLTVTGHSATRAAVTTASRR